VKLLWAIGLLLATSAPALACSCRGGHATFEKVLEYAPLAITGRVASVRKQRNEYSGATAIKIELEITRVLKGPVQDKRLTIWVNPPDARCDGLLQDMSDGKLVPGALVAVALATAAEARRYGHATYLFERFAVGERDFVLEGFCAQAVRYLPREN
jgi:hypothetical protein